MRRAALCLLLILVAVPAYAATIDGTNHDDKLWGTDRADTIYARGGDDRIHPGGRGDRVYCGAGFDVVYVQDFRDALHGCERVRYSPP